VPEVLAKQSEKAQRYHAVATARGTECMRCHRGISHPLPDDVLEASRREQERHAP
jgi:nitrate/TMAO reductase-like tetraheme cytochrome c subunit